MASMRIVFVTCPPDDAVQLLRTLVDERVVAGGNIVPGVRSIYRFKGEVHDESEAMLWMETSAERAEQLIDRVCELHPYEVPKIVCFEPRESSANYLAWVAAETA